MNILRLHSDDNVGLAIEPLGAGITTDDELKVKADIPVMHKIAVRDIKGGERILKYGQAIGVASADISAGEHVHVHNCEMPAHNGPGSVSINPPVADLIPQGQRKTFLGFRRSNGRAGTRNYVGILTSVNCSATVAKQIVRQVETSGILQQFPNVDGVVALTHGTGCGMQSSGDAFELLRRTIDGYIRHPNFNGVLLVGLGCEVMQPKLLEESGAVEAFRTLGIQEAGGTRAAIDTGVQVVEELLEQANLAEREPLPASDLVLSLQCGGSDAFSAITANPALGVAADLIVSQGGTAILSETPEICGAEHLLIERAASDQVASQLLDKIQWWQDYAETHGGSINSNPSPGNLAGGITTILEKSLGAQAKGGSTRLNAVLEYGQPVTEHGLNFMDSPGFDPVSVTGQVASGANLILFTTGRGSTFGFKPVPSLKLATNTPLYERMTDDMDIDCGTVVSAGESLEACGQRIFEEILAVASGRQTKSEQFGYGNNEFTPWQLGGVY